MFASYFAERATPNRTCDLTPPEVMALRLASHGLTAAMIADERGVSEQTVRTQLANARVKLAAKTTTHAVAVAMRHGLIP